MKDNFEKVLLQILKHEGGWSDHPRDTGGATMKGVTLAVFRRFYGPEKSKEDLREISDAQLNSIYRKDYWDKCWCDELPAGIDLAVFDTAVNSGPRRSILFIQQAAGSEVDGAIGPNTLKSVLDCEPGELINAMLDRRLAFLKSLGNWDAFGRGWARRVEDLRRSSLLLSGVLIHSDQDISEEEFEIVKLGSEGEWVERVQKALKIPVDGVFGVSTRGALIAFQEENGLEADGVAGRKTYSALALVGPAA